MARKKYWKNIDEIFINFLETEAALYHVFTLNLFRFYPFHDFYVLFGGRVLKFHSLQLIFVQVYIYWLIIESVCYVCHITTSLSEAFFAFYPLITLEFFFHTRPSQFRCPEKIGMVQTFTYIIQISTHRYSGEILSHLDI